MSSSQKTTPNSRKNPTFLKLKWLGLKRRILVARYRKDFQSRLNRIFSKDASRFGEKPLLIIKERDVGFFSLFLQVMNTLLCIKEEGLNCTVNVDFGDAQSYFTGSNTWTDVFEQFPSEYESSTSDKKDCVNRDFKKRINQADIWDYAGAIYKPEKGLYWSGSYYPRFTPQSSDVHITHTRVPTKPERQRASEIIKRHIFLRKDLQSELDQFIQTKGMSQILLKLKVVKLCVSHF